MTPLDATPVGGTLMVGTEHLALLATTFQLHGGDDAVPMTRHVMWRTSKPTPQRHPSAGATSFSSASSTCAQ